MISSILTLILFVFFFWCLYQLANTSWEIDGESSKNTSIRHSSENALEVTIEDLKMYILQLRSQKNSYSSDPLRITKAYALLVNIAYTYKVSLIDTSFINYSNTGSSDDSFGTRFSLKEGHLSHSRECKVLRQRDRVLRGDYYLESRFT